MTAFYGLPNEFLGVIASTADGTQPSSTYGTAVTPANNSYGSYATLIAGASVTFEVWEIEVRVENVGISAAARDCLVTIGVDPAGGTSFTDYITDLVCGPAGSLSSGADPGQPVVFRFPLRIGAGWTVGAKASVNSATVTAINVSCVLRGKPTRPDLVRRGSFCTTFGSTPASSNGTAITPGTTSEGAWTAIGSALSRTHWWWEFGYGLNTSTASDAFINVDIGIGDASNKKIAIYNAEVFTTVRETLKKPIAGRHAVGVSGDIVYARAQTSGPTTNQSIAVYAVGG